MAWIESHEEIGEHWKVHQLSLQLNCSVPTAVGYLHLLWHYTLKVAWRDGDLSKLPFQEVARACRFDGDPEVFVKALNECGFLDKMVVHQWLDYAGSIVYQRVYNEKRRLQKNCKKTVNKKQIKNKSSATLPNLTIPNHTNIDISKDISTGTTVEQVIESKPPTPIQQVVMGWKVLNDVPKDDKAWDKAHFPRYSKSAKTLLDLFGDVGTALDCMEWVWNDLTPKGLTVTIETVVKHSDRFRNRFTEVKNGLAHK